MKHCMARTRCIPVRVRSLARIQARLSLIRLSNGHGSGPLGMPLGMPLSTVCRAQSLSPNTLLRWDDDIPVPLTIDFMNISAATAACVFCVLACKPCFFAAISVQIAPAFCSSSLISSEIAPRSAQFLMKIRSYCIKLGQFAH